MSTLLNNYSLNVAVLVGKDVYSVGAIPTTSPASGKAWNQVPASVRLSMLLGCLIGGSQDMSFEHKMQLTGTVVGGTVEQLQAIVYAEGYKSARLTDVCSCSLETLVAGGLAIANQTDAQVDRAIAELQEAGVARTIAANMQAYEEESA